MGCAIGSLAGCCACSAASCCVSASCSMCGKVVSCRKSSATRGIYVFQFLVVALVAYIFSNFAHDWLKNVPVLQQCPPDSTCFGALAVYRICFGLTAYHIVLGLLTIGVSSGSDWRVQIQDGWWPIKFICLLGITIAAFFIPNSFYIVYGWIMLVGAAFFIIIQLVLLIEFAYSWNETWLLKMENEEDEGGSTWYYLLLGSTIVMICASIALTGVMYKFFCPDGCDLNTFYVTINLVVCLILCFLSLHPRVREGRPSSGLLQSAVVSMYATYLVFSAMNSGPDKQCNPLSWSGGTKTFSLIIGAAFTIVSVVYSTIRAASASGDLLGTSDSGSGGDIEKSPLVVPTDAAGDTTESPIENDEVDSTVYNYTHFHLSFALGSMYICMLLTNWMTISGTDNTIYVDSGVASVWIKIVSGWVVLLLYLWTLIAPVLLPDREWA